MASATTVGILRVLLSANSSEFETALQKSAKATRQWSGDAGKAQQATSLFSGSVAKLTGAFSGALLISQATAALVAWGREAVVSAGKIVDLSSKTGISIEAIQRMSYVAKQTSTDVNTFATAAFNLGVRLSGGSNSVSSAVAQLGLSFSNLRTLKPEAQFDAITRALGAMEDPQKRNEIAVALFGRTAKDILPAIEQGYAKIAAEARISSAEQVKAVDAASDAWGGFVENTKSSIVSFLGNLVLANQEAKSLDWVFAPLIDTSNVKADFAKISDWWDILKGRLGQPITVSSPFAAIIDSQVAGFMKELPADLDAIEKALDKETAAQKRAGDAAAAHAKEIERITVRFGDNQKAVDAIELSMHQWMRTTDVLNAMALPTMYGNLEAINIRLATGIPLWSTYTSVMSEVTVETQAVKGHLDALLGSMTELPMEAAPAVQAVGTAFGTIGTTLGTLNTSIVGTFAQMTLHAKGFKDGFVDIWESIKGAITKIFTDILGDFTNRLLGGLMNAMKGGSFSSAFAGMFTGGGGGGSVTNSIASAVVKGLLGTGGAAAVGGVTTGAVVGGAGMLSAAPIAGTLGLAGAGAGTGAGLGGTAAGIGAGIGTGAMIGATAGIGAAALLAWAIWKKGLFRGGEESLKVNKPRDQYLQDFETGGSRAVDMTGTAPGGVGSSLAGQLTVAGAGAGGGALMQAIFKADTVKEWNAAVQAAEGFLDAYKEKQLETAAAAKATGDAEIQAAADTAAAAKNKVAALTAEWDVARDKALASIADLQAQQTQLLDSIKDEAPEEMMGSIESATRDRIALLAAETAKQQAALDEMSVAAALAIHKATAETSKAATDLGTDIEDTVDVSKTAFGDLTNKGIGPVTSAVLDAEGRVVVFGDAVVDAAQRGIDRLIILKGWVDAVAEGSSPGGFRGISERAREAGQVIVQMAGVGARSLEGLVRGTQSLADGLTKALGFVLGPGDYAEFMREGATTVDAALAYMKKQREGRGDYSPIDVRDLPHGMDADRLRSPLDPSGSSGTAGGGDTYEINITVGEGAPTDPRKAKEMGYLVADTFIGIIDRDEGGRRGRLVRAQRLTPVTS